MKALFALMFVVSLFGCSSVSGPEPRAQLVGEWRYSDAVQSCRYSFKNDGSFTGEVMMRSKVVSQFTGRWSVEGKTLFYRYSSDALGRIPPGATDQDELLEITRDSFVIRAANGDRRRYLRTL